MGAETRAARINPWRILKMFILGLPPAMQDQLLFLWYAGGRNWVGSRAFVIPNDEMIGSIGVAIKERDRYRLVEPGKEYRGIRRDIGQAVSQTQRASGSPMWLCIGIIPSRGHHFTRRASALSVCARRVFAPAVIRPVGS
jgi:hypothetical protein